MKKLGILCHITSLASEQGIGDFGRASFDFIDTISQTPISLWQILPLCDTNEYNCPYGTMSSISIDPMFVDVNDLLDKRLVCEGDISGYLALQHSARIDYSKVKKAKAKIFDIAFDNLSVEGLKEVENFAKQRPDIERYAYYKTLLNVHHADDFRNTPSPLWNYKGEEGINFAKENRGKLDKIIFQQYILDRQWQKVKKYANDRGISIVGDLPIYCDKRSFDVFDSPQVFKLGKDLQPLATGGVPADDFSADGQNWGTCVYDWDYLEKTNYTWFTNRISLMQKRYDILRLDHFAGYVTPFEIYGDFANAKWAKGGGEKIFKAIQKHCNIKNIVVEDLGVMHEDCIKIKKKFNLAGMAVLQFAFSGKDNPYLPQNVGENTFYYLGTHDNNTYIGFLNSLSSQEKENAKNLLSISTEKIDYTAILIESVKKMLKSKSDTIILQIQDLLLQDESQRINYPGVAEGCWEYRVPLSYRHQLHKTLDQILR